MTIREILSMLSGVVLLVAFLPYLTATVKRQATPRKATWLVWATGDWILIFGMMAKGTFSWLIAAACLGASAAFVLSLMYGEKGWKTRDKICLALSAVGVALWLYFGESNLGIAFGSLSLMIAAWPTYLSAWENPLNEDASSWIIFNVSSVLGVLAIPHLTFADVVPPLTFLLIDGPMIYLLFIRPTLRQRKWDRLIDGL